ncbi:hypothetical protein [Falsirhodobacter algicola]|uniref:Transmembrane protein n=1 Tax=Falsirhodobacter algicola TaxID=2692330 RepID=A0A8J8SMB7_9RHOB|nr:hypothetical protein [Falsirhodobacter algicola]QUS37274.1 hypothetical protein GR316_12890 [Falsirhodobacter algicola]
MRVLIALLGGFLVWSAAFLALYATQATGCSLGWPRGVLRAVLIAMLAGFALLSLVPLALARRSADPFLRRTATLTGIAASAAVALCFSGILWMAPC